MKSLRYLAIAASVAILAGATAVPAHARGGGGGAHPVGGMQHGGMQHGGMQHGDMQHGSHEQHMGSGGGLAGVLTERPACGIPDSQIPLDAKCSPTRR